MSNPTTNFLVGGLDLSSIFQPLSLGSAYGTPTGYKIHDNDLNQIFAAYPGSGPKANPTGYRIGGNDLCNIFAKYQPFFIATGNYTYSYITNGYYLLYFGAGPGSIKFLFDLSNVYIAITGGGGGGAGTPSPSSSYNYYGSGGGGGGQALLNYNVRANTVYNINVGIGGTGSYNSNGGNGEATTFDGSITVNGGGGGIFGSNASAPHSVLIPNIGGTGGNGTTASTSTNKTIVYTGNGGNGGAGGVNPFLSGSVSYAKTTSGLSWGGYGLDSSFFTNSNILSLEDGLLKTAGGGAGSAGLYGGGGGIGGGGAPSKSPVTTNGYVPGAGGGGGNYGVTPGDGKDGICAIYFQYPQQNVPFVFTTGHYVYHYTSNYYYITFTDTGTFIPSIDISDAIVVAVGGGGGGGGGTVSEVTAGGGGGGGGAGVIKNVTLNYGKNYYIFIGKGGQGGNNTDGTFGTNSYFKNNDTGVTYIRSTGGSSGSRLTVDGNGGGGSGGTTIVGGGYSLVDNGTGNGGNGGNANRNTNYYGVNGGSSEIYTFNSNTGYLLPNLKKIYFSGGGGGGKSGNTSICQGGTPGNGHGGSYGYGSNNIAWPNNLSGTQYPPLNSSKGLDAVLYGAGGGGGSESIGGNGADGVIMLIFKYP